MVLTFDALYANYKAVGGTVAVLVSTDLTDATTAAGIAAATWNDLTANFTIPTSNSNGGDIENVGSVDLSSYVGKTVYVAFRYQGSGTASTTIRIDNVSVGTPGRDVYSTINTLYSYTGTEWALYTVDDVLMLNQADFDVMGLERDNFSTSLNPNNYLPTFLKQLYPYAQEEDVMVPVYKFYNTSSKKTTVRADEYIFTDGQFVKNDAIETVTSQFVRSNGKWNFDPSTVVNVAGKGDADASVFYQIITDWVKANKGTEYVSSYGNNDYYYGGSAYNNNFDFRPSAWKGQVAAEYGAMSDEELTKLMFDRLPEAFLPALKVLYPDAAPVVGVEVIYTVNFFIYDGAATLPYTLKYKVTGLGVFEYIKDSLMKK